MSVKAYFELVRIHNVIGSAISVFMGYVVASEWKIVPIKLILAMIVVSVIAAGGYIINDVFDIEIDKINKPNRPLPSGRIKISRARSLSIVLFLVGIVLSVLLNIYAFIIALLTVLALYYYAKDLKKQGLVGNLIVALTSALSAFYGGLAFFEGSWVIRTLIPTLYIFFFTLTREFVKGIEDVKGDMTNGVKTLAVRVGIEKTWFISKIILVILIVTSFIPYFFGFNIIYLIGILFLDIILILVVLLRHDIESASKARAYMKVYALGTLILFALGTLPI
ncbi:UbiA family prenyltransferase [Sulfurisphaera tokodaii]|uniref:Digeranylgeranylglyceryl phosphate synthase n=2 Tax=Sulfurisphaera tokodaii TaxID=111955 RepID=DGGGP_SULTO|nr:UbiA family prenyltransferase [Sulfurisphaera tokodaii]Q971A3.1 RecName: Full=Digeranylgeranylglyceryl phosphate synthase; Short=DGGGP synthase; Short=DGGGPS; AltName: Full=(S)-2,3-di-O-geranylgeranylglyceryl phosphate synthase; AltName: Full=Geranylgeranylglycerol-phosphate geranylgeranyltransferase [Sulfurisphaera tokodaii str. 7]BAB66520.1 (S)-2,3-di-O-geranylgeranylglyceryl phosphate synthase [Sulfurisphaera tokodaii str. 7]HII73664.1 UbiA family prenyltransferase [Sulfurisphaera tokodaii